MAKTKSQGNQKSQGGAVRSKSGGASPSPAQPAGAGLSPVTAKAEPKRPGKLDQAMDFFRSQKPASGRPAVCSCSWAGELSECEEKSLGESETGWSWLCPRCGSVVLTYAFVILK